MTSEEVKLSLWKRFMKAVYPVSKYWINRKGYLASTGRWHNGPTLDEILAIRPVIQPQQVGDCKRVPVLPTGRIESRPIPKPSYVGSEYHRRHQPYVILKLPQ